MIESYVIQNISPGPVSCSIFIPYMIPDGMPKHKRRKLIKGSSQGVVFPPRQTLDLVKVTGLSVEELRRQPELNKILHHPHKRLLLLEPKVEEDKVEEPPVEPVVVETPAPELPVEPSVPVVEPVVAEPPAPEPASELPAGGPPVGMPPGAPPMGAPPAGAPPADKKD